MRSNRPAYIVRRTPTAAEQARIAHAARERAETLRTVRDGVIAAVLVMATVWAILAAGAVPTRAALAPPFRLICAGAPPHHAIPVHGGVCPTIPRRVWG